MTICIDASPAVHQRAGMGRYVQELTAALVSLDSPPDLVAFYNRADQAHITPPFDRLPHLALPFQDKPWRLQVALAHTLGIPQDKLFSGIKLFHGTDHLLPHLASIRSVFTLQDLTFRTHPRTHLSLNRWFNILLLPFFLKQASAVIVPSESTRRDAARLYPWSVSKTQVIYDAAHPRFKRQPLAEQKRTRQKYSLPEEYLLFVGTIEPRKNLTSLLEALPTLLARGYRHHLVIAGRPGWGSKPFFQKLHELELEKQVHILGFVPDSDLPGLYSAADVFVFPSLYEGFGLPLLEALSCGTPSISSNTSSLPELAGEAALLIDPQDQTAWEAALPALLGDEDQKAFLRAQGPKQAAHFSWERAARETYEVYRRLL